MRRYFVKDSMTRWGGMLAIIVLVMCVFGSQQVLAQVNLTKHNLSTKQVVRTKDSAAAPCVFCHTPIGAESNAAVPFWSRIVGLPTAYQTYNSLGTSSLDDTNAPVGSVSLVCLSCHDGVLAMNVTINAPDSGRRRDPNAALRGPFTGSLQTFDRLTEVLPFDVPLNLRYDHPIGVQYGGGPTEPDVIPLAPAAYPNTLFRDRDFVSASSATLNRQSVWWVDTPGGVANTREKSDMQLYTRVNAQAIGASGVIAGPQPFVECASCHDPHSATYPTFLRMLNNGSAVCLSCHIK